jgi:5-methylthioribose kinase
MLGRIVEEPADQDIHGVVKGRGEQHPLALRRGCVQQPAHRRQKAEIGHVIGFVYHADLDVTEMAVALADQVSQPARAGDDDVHPVT